MPGEDRTHGDWPLVHLAEGQEGLVTHRQLLALGMSADAVEHRLRVGRLHRRHRGVYSVGHRLIGPRGILLAAAWAGGRNAVLSHLSAAAFYGWVTKPPAVQHVTTTRAATTRAGLCVHRVRRLDERDVQRFGLLAVTRRARTVVDLAAILAWDEFRAVVDRIPTRDLDVAAVRAARERASGRRGARTLRRLLGHLEAHTKSEFERRYLRFCRRYGVPLPSGVNVEVAGLLVDCSSEAQRVALELDSRAWHARRDQMAVDRRRDRQLVRAGRTPVRLVWEDLDAEAAAATAADLLAILTS